MNSRPTLVKHESAVQRQLSIKTETQSNAQFIMGLNNRVAKLDKRLDRLEETLIHTIKHNIGHRELALTFILALLVFTSVVLAVKELLPNSTQHKPQLFNQTNSEPLAQFNPGKGNLFTEKRLYSWPLEKQDTINGIQYSQHKHGIHISAQLGDPVIAIAKGKVIYSGNAISSYGHLILIQHENDIISVYGNNYSNYVSEGESITRNQLIAAAGEANSNQAKLYFEIRHKGKPEDPFLYFP